MAHILAHVYELLGPCFKTGQMEPAIPTPHFAPEQVNHQTQTDRKNDVI